jgi:hypothetical protein
MLPKLIAINKALLSVYFIEDSYYIDIKEANVYSKRVEISNLPQLTRNNVTFVEWNAFTEFLSSIKSPTFLEQQAIDAIKKQWNFDLAEEGLAEEEVENNQLQKDDYFIKY